LIHPVAALSLPFIAAFNASFILARTSSTVDDVEGAGDETLRSRWVVVNDLEDRAMRTDGVRRERVTGNMVPRW
jgi:hypothetical protein